MPSPPRAKNKTRGVRPGAGLPVFASRQTGILPMRLSVTEERAAARLAAGLDRLRRLYDIRIDGQEARR